MIAIPSTASAHPRLDRLPRLGFLGVGWIDRHRPEPELARSLAARGLETIRARHSCAHRVDELLAALAEVR